MTDLNNRKQIAAIDKASALGSIEQLPEQCEQALNECNEITLPDDYPTVSHVIVTGMGASWLGAHIMQGLLADRLTRPLLVLHDYQMPEFVSAKSLVIASSYSGTTADMPVSTIQLIARDWAWVIQLWRRWSYFQKLVSYQSRLRKLLT